MTWPGHSVIVVPVPALEPFVRARTAHHDDSFLSTDPAFVHAHVTLLGPWLADPGPDDLARVADVLASLPLVDLELAEVATFPDGLLHLRAEPADVLRTATARLAAAFPDHPPYGGAYPDPVPHLTLDRVAPGVSAAGVRAELADVLPVRQRVERVDLQWWANHDCHVRHSWSLAAAVR